MLKLIPVSRIQSKIEALAIPVSQDGAIHDQPDLLEMVAAAKALPEFSGETGQQVTLYDLNQGKTRRCIFMGIGARDKLDAETLRTFAGRAVKNAMANKWDQLILAAPQTRIYR